VGEVDVSHKSRIHKQYSTQMGGSVVQQTLHCICRDRDPTYPEIEDDMSTRSKHDIFHTRMR
jgi:hypothetical protein